MTILDAFRRLQHEQRKLMLGDIPLVKAVRIGAPQWMTMKAEIQPWQRSTVGDEQEIAEGYGTLNGIRFYTDPEFDGIEIEYIDNGYSDDAVREIARVTGLPCRAI